MESIADKEELRRRNLREWIRAKGLTQAELARKISVSRSYFGSVLAGSENRPFTERTARMIETKLSNAGMRIEPGFLDRDMGNNSTKTVEAWSDPSELSSDVYALVKRVELRLSAGNGTVAVEHVEEPMPPLAFRRDWLIRRNVTSLNNLRVCHVHGDSMEPLLLQDDVVLIDMGQTEVQSGDVYALNYGGEMRIKRLVRRFDGALILKSENPAWKEEAISGEDLAHVRVLGRMIWRGG